MAQGAVEVEGLREFRRAVKQVSSDLEKDLKRAMKADVAQPLAEKVKSEVPTRSGRWRGVIRGGATAKNAYIQWGKAKVPYAAWREFGGKLPQGPKLPFRKGGRFVHPTVESNREQAGEAAATVLEQTMRRARLQLE